MSDVSQVKSDLIHTGEQDGGCGEEEDEEQQNWRKGGVMTKKYKGREETTGRGGEGLGREGGGEGRVSVGGRRGMSVGGGGGRRE